MLRVGPAGNSIPFYDQGYKHTYEAAKWLSDMGLNAFEYSFGRGVKINPDTAAKIRTEMEKYDVQISVHSPYYTNFANTDPEMIQKSIGYVIDSLKAARAFGGNRAVVHPAAMGKLSRDEAVSLTENNLRLLADSIEKEGLTDTYACLETMGKIKQIGTAEETVRFCKISDNFLPCYDFGHINSYMRGGLKTKDDFRRVIDLAFEGLGEVRAKNMHIHFSKIQYGDSGEIRHLTFEDDKYGPDYEPLIELIVEYKMTPVIICESNGYMSDDALIIKNYYKNISHLA